MSRSNLLVLLAIASGALAQTWSACNPRTKSSCPADAALGTTLNETWTAASTQLSPQLWNVSAGGQWINFTDKGAEMTISKSGQSVTVESLFYIFWGRVEVIMQAAAGQGIISTFDLLSDDLDEIDLEIMGGNTSYVESNWYGWGNTSQYNALYHPVSGPQESMHNYTIIWNENETQWIFDGNVARTLPSARAGRYPQTPSIMKFGIWAGGDSTEPAGTIKWAGGPTDWTKGPFTMTIQSILVTDGHTNTSSYVWGDRTGDWQSITATPGTSEFYKLLHQQSTVQQAQATWNGLSKTAKIGIATGVICFLVALVLAYTMICIVQRKRGRAEKAIADREWDAHTAELMEYRTKMAKGDFAVSHMGHGEKF